MLQITDPRQQRGLEIAATTNLVRKGARGLSHRCPAKAATRFARMSTNRIASARITSRAA